MGADIRGGLMVWILHVMKGVFTEGCSRFCGWNYALEE